MPGPIYLITGAPASGKSTVADALLESFPFGFHIDVDGIREMVVSGFTSPFEWNDESARQFDVAVRGAAALASVYSDADFAVVIEAAIDPDYVTRTVVPLLGAERIALVLLDPGLDVARARNRRRSNKDFDTSVLDQVIVDLYQQIGTTDWSGWHVIDSSDQTVPETVDAILHLTTS